MNVYVRMRRRRRGDEEEEERGLGGGEENEKKIREERRGDRRQRMRHLRKEVIRIKAEEYDKEKLEKEKRLQR